MGVLLGCQQLTLAVLMLLQLLSQLLDLLLSIKQMLTQLLYQLLLLYICSQMSTCTHSSMYQL